MPKPKALVVLLKGVNVGGHRTFRPKILAEELKRLDVVNIGAAGTFVVRKSVDREELRAEIERRLPFEAEVMICSETEIVRLAACDPFAAYGSGPDVVRFVSLMATSRQPLSPLPLDLPGEGDWGLRVLACQDRFILGLYRRQMKAIAYLGQLEKICNVPLATRSWNTVQTIVRVLRA